MCRSCCGSRATCGRASGPTPASKACGDACGRTTISGSPTAASRCDWSNITSSYPRSCRSRGCSSTTYRRPVWRFSSLGSSSTVVLASFSVPRPVFIRKPCCSPACSAVPPRALPLEEARQRRVRRLLRRAPRVGRLVAQPPPALEATRLAQTGVPRTNPLAVLEKTALALFVRASAVGACPVSPSRPFAFAS